MLQPNDVIIVIRWGRGNAPRSLKIKRVPIAGGKWPNTGTERGGDGYFIILCEHFCLNEFTFSMATGSLISFAPPGGSS